MTWVGIAASPAFRAGFLICAEKGFMVLSCLMRQQRAVAGALFVGVPNCYGLGRPRPVLDVEADGGPVLAR
jgi:hypothetical protein